MEEWRTIPMFPKYEVSNLGRIRNKRTERVLKTSISNWGYVRAPVRSENKSCYCSVHRAVASAFIPNTDSVHKTQVNHINCDKTDNRVENLEWTSPVENMAHAYAHDLVPIVGRKPVLMFRPGNEAPIRIYRSASDASRDLSKTEGNQGNITRSAQSGGKKSALGYVWKYAEERYGKDVYNLFK